VAEISTELSPLHLLDELQNIENLAGRVRKDNRWGARILDLDMLLFDNDVISHERLTVPHYGLELREFVLLPLAEIAAELILPNGKNISVLSQNIETNGLKIHSKLR
jgi:2-amino-4-hydroxy-6-hydroxymethyldihydropteridine diphosphokinase